ncbi:MAG: tellurite resistance TerB family protein [Micropepsaceae bacterium]
MIDAKKMLDQFLNSGAATGVVAGMLGGALANKAGLGGIAKIGGLALVGTLAYQAYNKYKDQQAQLPAGQRAQGGIGSTVSGVFQNLPGVGDLLKNMQGNQAPEGSGFASTALSDQQQNLLGTVVLTAMIAAAKSDGHVDQAESQKIFGQMEQAGLSSDEKAFLLGELAKPLNMEDVVKHATSPEIAAQLYTASAIVVDQANDQERNYLAMLAQRMGVPQGFIDQLNQQLAR